MADILEDIRACITTHGHADIAEKVINALRLRYGGDRLYIPVRDRDMQRKAINKVLREGGNARDAAQKAGCSLSTVNRLRS